MTGTDPEPTTVAIVGAGPSGLTPVDMRGVLREPMCATAGCTWWATRRTFAELMAGIH